MAFPQNEEQTIQLYRLIQNRIGWRIVESQTNAFPDAVLESDDGERLACEFEHLSKNFKKHGHPVDGSCDLIICWRDNWPKSPLPVMALEGCAKEEAKAIRTLLGSSVSRSDYMRLKNEAQALQQELDETQRMLERATGQLEWIEEDFECFLGDVYEEVMSDIALRELERQHGLEDGILTNQGAGWLKVRRKDNSRKITFFNKWGFAILALALFYLLLDILDIISL